ncbi:MAG: cytochrome c-type biogenesis protein CcmH [Actinomycetota bacterium]|nr:cytochrome c-type biogenesis protein CcmH [Actinomycetota bacterium]
MKRILLVTSLLVAVAAPASASPQDLANDISNEIMSPFCPGVTLHDCPSKAALNLRDQIEEWAAAGWSRERIMSELVSQYGERVRGAPLTRGSGLLAWVLPGLALIGGLAIAFALARRWTRRPSPIPPTSTISADDRNRLERELSSFRSQT